jgi:hypothetical protein
MGINMNLSKLAALIAVAGAFAFTGISGNATPLQNGSSVALQPEYPLFAQSSGYKSVAKVAAFVSENVGIVRSVHVKSVTRPQTGVFCVKPSVSLVLSAIYPVVTVEWSQSSGNALVAYVDEDAENCSSGEIEVRTFNLKSGSPVASNNVGFFLFVE